MNGCFLDPHIIIILVALECLTILLSALHVCTRKKQDTVLGDIVFVDTIGGNIFEIGRASCRERV